MRLEFSLKEANDKKRYFFRAPPEITRGGPPPPLWANRPSNENTDDRKMKTQKCLKNSGR